MLQFIEQGSVFNSYNYSLSYCCDDNSTVSGTGLGMLWCPSDGDIVAAVYLEAPSLNHTNPWPVKFTRYAGNHDQWAGTITGDTATAANPAAIAAVLQQQNGPLITNGYVSFLAGASQAPVSVVLVTDETINTIGFGEHAHSLLSKADNSFYKWNWWVSGNYSDIAFTVYYPINAQKRSVNYTNETEASTFISAATSFHPGGANFPFCDGSVRFLNDTISTWKLDSTGIPLGLARDTNGVWQVTSATVYKPGIYQALGLTNGCEVISGDSF